MSPHLTLDIRLLGTFRIAEGDRLLTAINTSRLQALLAYLLLNRQAPQSRQRIAFLFWPDSVEAQALNNLRSLLVALRRTLPNADSYIQIDRQTLRWHPGEDAPYTLDIARFETALAGAAAGAGSEMRDLQQAVDLYSGDLLPGCYDEWIIAQREQLREAFLAALSRLVQLLASKPDLPTAILYSQRLLRHDPLREENYRVLMRLHLSNNDHAGVATVFQACERVLKRELQVEPGQATINILNQSQQLSQARAPGNITRGKRSKAEAGKSPSPPGNLPALATPFIGRENHIVNLLDLLRKEQVRLVTLTGTAGIGKTRMSLQVASLLQSQSAFPGGIFYVALAALAEPNEEMVTRAIANALELTEGGPVPLRDTLRTAIQDKHLLIVLDNFEHMLPAAPLLSYLLSNSPGLKLLVTSRASLNLSGEHEYAVPPMSMPGHNIPLQADDLLQYETVALFVERAMEVLPGFALTHENTRAVAEICRRVEGLPLAIELAAARVKVLQPEAIASRLDRRLKLLVGGRIDLPPHQRALESAIAWSYNLLSDEEKALFRGLSVFSGGCSLESVEAVLGTLSSNILDCISSLVNKSLLVRLEEPDSEPRFSMLETLREYADARLVAQGEAETVQHLHANHFMQMAQDSQSQLWSADQREWLERLDLEHDNMRAALRWAYKTGHDNIALDLTNGLARFWDLRGYWSEGRDWARQALLLNPDEMSNRRAESLWRASFLAIRQRDYERAQPLLEQSEQMYLALGDKVGLANVYNALAVLWVDKNYERALEYHNKSLALRRELGDKSKIWLTLHNMSFIKVNQGKWDEALRLSEEALSICRELGVGLGIAYTHYVLGYVARGQGDLDLAQELFIVCLNGSREMKNHVMVAWALNELGEVYYQMQLYGQSKEALEEAKTLFMEMGDTLGSANVLVKQGRDAQRQAEYDKAIALYREALALGTELDNDVVVGACLAGFAGILQAKKHTREAVMLFACADDLLRELYTSLERVNMTLGLAEARAALPPDIFEALWAEGTAMPGEPAIEIANRFLQVRDIAQIKRAHEPG